MQIEITIAARSGVRLFMLREDDVSHAYVRWLNDPEVNRYLESRFQKHDAVSTRQFVRAMHDSADNLLLGIFSEHVGAHVGNIKIGPINRYHLTGEIGILIGEKRAWGKGIATTAITMMCELARTELQLHKATAGCYASNVGSRRAFEKAGFEVEGVRKQQVLTGDGVREDLVLLGRVLR